MGMGKRKPVVVSAHFGSHGHRRIHERADLPTAEQMIVSATSRATCSPRKQRKFFSVIWSMRQFIPARFLPVLKYLETLRPVRRQGWIGSDVYPSTPVSPLPSQESPIL